MKFYFKILLLFVSVIFQMQLFSMSRVLGLGAEIPGYARSRVLGLGVEIPRYARLARCLSMALPDSVNITWATARDGIQNLKRNKPLTLEERIRIINSEYGYRQEYGSFVKPSLLPNAAQPNLIVEKMVESGIAPLTKKVSILVGNFHGFKDFAKLFNSVPDVWKNALEVAFFTSACPEFLRRNTGFSSIEKHLDVARQIALEAKSIGILHKRVFVSMAFRSPFSTDDLTGRASDICKELYDMGYTEVVPADTNGIASVSQVIKLYSGLRVAGITREFLGFHGHDLGNEIQTLVACLPFVHTVDVTVSGIGGCPFSPGSPGNMNARKVADALQELGVDTGINYQRLKIAEEVVAGILNQS